MIVEAEAGMGKTAFLAWLSRERGYVHHFVRLMTDPDDVAAAVRNLASQIIVAWDLERLAPGGVLPPTAGRPAFLRELLEEAARQRDALRPGEPIVLVVDGLNETSPAPGMNPLGLPATLPAGVFVIAAQRPVHVRLRIEVPRAFVTIGRDTDENRRDVREHLVRVAGSPALAARLQAAGVQVAEFVETLLERSGGVWIYVHYVLAEVERGRRSPAELDRLPGGLWQYYAQFWQAWQADHGDRWADRDLPLLALLGAASEPLSAAVLADLADIERTEDVEALLSDPWRPFIELEATGPATTYRVFHDSLREYVRGDRPPTDVAVADRTFAARLAAATRAAHGTIADRSLQRWGGLEELASLRVGTRDPDGGYGYRHVADHLVRAGRWADLDALLSVSWLDGDRRSNAWFRVRARRGELSAYRRDVLAALQAAREQAAAKRAAIQLRYALMLSSVASQAATTPPGLWRVLVRAGLLTAREALEYVRLVPTAEERAEGLTALIDAVPDDLRRDVELEALAAVRTVPDGYWRVGELWRLHEKLSARLRPELETIASTLGDPYYRVVADRLLGRAEAGEGLRIGSGSEPDPNSPSGLAGSALFVEAYVRRREFAARQLESAGLGYSTDGPDPGPVERYWRSHVLVEHLAHATGADEQLLLSAAMSIGEEIGDVQAAEAAFAAVGDAFAALGTLDEASMLSLEKRIGRASWRAALLLHARCATPAWRTASVAALGAVKDDSTRARLLTAARRSAAACTLDIQRALLATIEDDAIRTETWLGILPTADAGVAEAVAAEILAEQESAIEKLGRSRFLVGASAWLPAEAVARAEAAAGGLEDPGDRTAAMLAIGLRWCALGRWSDADRIRGSLGGAWQSALTEGLAEAHARSGDPDRAVQLARGETRTSWPARILALVATRLDEPVATQLIDEALGSVNRLDDASQAIVLATATTAAPEGHRDRLADAARLAIQNLGTDRDAPAAGLALARALAATGRSVAALDVASNIDNDPIRAEALVTIVGQDGEARSAAIRQLDALRDPVARVRVLLALLAATQGQPANDDVPPALASVLEAVLLEFTGHRRDRLMDGLPAILPAIVQVDGRESPGVVAEDLLSVLEWWP